MSYIISLTAKRDELRTRSITTYIYIYTCLKPHYTTQHYLTSFLPPNPMAPYSTSPPLLLLLVSLSSFLLLSSSSSQRPHALVASVRKDPTLQYLSTISMRTPLTPLPLVLDLGGRFLWVDCDTDYVSSTYRPVRCHSAPCSLAKSTSCGDCFSPPGPGCNNNTCGLSPDNPITRTSTGGELAQDVLSLPSTDGFNPGPPAAAPHFIFSCAPAFLLQGLAQGATGMAGLGRTKIALPSQLSATFSFPRTFALCLSSSTSADGVVFFGDGPYRLLPNVDASQSLIYTPLIVNPVCTAGTCTEGEKSDEYFIGVKSINVSDQTVPINSTLLSIDSSGVGGTKISTVTPYTTMESSIYRAVTKAFVTALAGIKRVASVHPFEVCYNVSDIGSTRVGPAVPSIDLVLQNETVYWAIFGANSMVQVNNEVICLGFLDGGMNPRTSIVIGGYQIEDNLLQFDLARSRLGFSSSLFFRPPPCANFNFTSNA